MSFRGKKISQLIKMSLALVGVLGTTMLSDVSTAYAEKIIHTHIWATKYDNTKHWEYCTVCGETQESKEHKYTDNWEFGYESCHKSNGNNFNTKICECGYSYVVRKDHVEEEKWNNTGVRMVHYKRCSVCKDWTRSGNCSNSKGKLGCTNPGKCDTCGFEATKDYHYITTNGKCRDCGKKIFEASDYKVEYDKDYKTATITFTFKPADKTVELTGTMGAYCGAPNYTTNKWTYNKKSDGSVDYTGVYTFDSTKQRKSKLNFLDRTGAVKVNGVSLYTDASIYKFDIWQDHKAPEVKEIKQVDQTLHNTWATIKELTITGTENLSKMVTISILDKETKDIIVDKAKTVVKDGKYTYMCTPPLEGPEAGRKYVLKVEDEIGNVKEQDFTIYKTDCRAPLLRSEKEYVEWSRTKNLSLELTDYGAGSPATSLVNQTSYKNATKSGDKYFAKYTFDEDNYGVTTYNLYVRDGLGNAGKEVIKVGKIDNTKPTVEELKFDLNKEVGIPEGEPVSDKAIGAIIMVKANDMNKKLGAEGSGVAGYALTKSEEQPKAEEWLTTDTLEAKEAGIYYLWVKDTAGNMADVTVLKVNDDFSVEILEKVPVEDEKNEPVIEDEDDKKDNKKDDKESDETPKTGDNAYLLLAGMLVGISAIVMVVVKRRRVR